MRRLPMLAVVGFGVVSLGLEVVIGWRWGLSAPLPSCLFLGAVGFLIALVDVMDGRIPNALVLPAYPVVLALLIVGSAIDHDWYGLIRAATGMLVLGAFYLLLALLRPGELGFGDVKLAGLLGSVLGWLGFRTLALAALLGPMFAATGLLVLISTR